MNPQVTQKVEDEVVKKMAENPEQTVDLLRRTYLMVPHSIGDNMMTQWREANKEQKDEAKRKKYDAHFDAWEKERNGH